MRSTGGAALPHHDVVVVGGGPGGASTAYHLLRQAPGFKVALVERLRSERFAHYHRMCGEGISQAGLREIGLPTDGLVEERVHTIMEHWPGGVDLKVRAKGALIDRVALLRTLTDRFVGLGGEVVDDGAARFVGNGAGMEVHLTSGAVLSTDYLVGADGALSKVRARYFPELVPELVWADQFVTDRPTEPGTLHFHYDQRYTGGYKWVFPAKDGSRIGFPRGTEAPPPGTLQRHRRAIPIAKADRVVNSRVCLVGDAACQANAISFGGIRPALVAGRMAGAALAHGDVSIYQREWLGSHYAKASDVSIYHRLRAMDNESLARTARPFRGGFYGLGTVGTAGALLFSRDRDLYRAFLASGKYGW